MEARRATSAAGRCCKWCGEKRGDVLSLLMPPRGGWELLWSKYPPWLHFPGLRREIRHVRVKRPLTTKKYRVLAWPLTPQQGSIRK